MREWAIQNAEQWVRDYHVDGLRLDAVHAIFDDSPRHICAELAERVRDVNPRALVISEMEVDNWRPIEEWGHDAQWADSSHHELHVLLTGEREGYYTSYGSVRAPRGGSRRRRDTIRGGSSCARRTTTRSATEPSATGCRRTRCSVAAAVTLFSPCTPLLFMGEEYLEPHPFQFFTDHIDPAIAEATRDGRQEGVRGVRRLLRRGRAGPAGRRDVPALEARAAASPIRSTASCSRCAASCRASSRCSRPTRTRKLLRLRRGDDRARRGLRARSR